MLVIDDQAVVDLRPPSWEREPQEGYRSQIAIDWIGGQGRSQGHREAYLDHSVLHTAMVNGKRSPVKLIIDSGLAHCILFESFSMPFVKIPVKRAHTFVPSEARSIAASWRQLAHEIAALATSLRGLGGDLQGTWEGNSAQRFLGEYHPEPGNTDSSANLLNSLANEVESITVTEWETVWETVWQSGDGSGSG